MKFLIAANLKYKEMADISIGRVKALGYQCEVYDMGDLGTGTDIRDHFDVELPLSKFDICRLKPHLILRTLKDCEETLVYLDADAFLMHRIDEIEAIEFDLGLTYRYSKDNRYVNAGVIFSRQGAVGFIQKWIDNIPENPPEHERKKTGDQLYLNRLVFGALDKGAWLKNRTKLIHKTKVHFFEVAKYNVTPSANGIQPKHKIIHLPGGHRRFKEQAYKWNLKDIIT